MLVLNLRSGPTCAYIPISTFWCFHNFLLIICCWRILCHSFVYLFVLGRILLCHNFIYLFTFLFVYFILSLYFHYLHFIFTYFHYIVRVKSVMVVPFRLGELWKIQQLPVMRLWTMPEEEVIDAESVNTWSVGRVGAITHRSKLFTVWFFLVHCVKVTWTSSNGCIHTHSPWTSFCWLNLSIPHYK